MIDCLANNLNLNDSINDVFTSFLINQASVNNCLAIESSIDLITSYNCKELELNYVCQKSINLFVYIYLILI